MIPPALVARSRSRRHRCRFAAVALLVTAMVLGLAPRPAGATTAALTGTVRGPSGPVDGMGVFVYDATTGTAVASTSSVGGAFSFDALPAGAYRLLFWSATAPFPATWYPAAPSMADATNVVVADSATTSVAEDLTPPATVSGTVRFGTTPLGGTKVWAYSVPNGTWVAATTTDPDGSYSFGSLVAGTYRLHAWNASVGGWYAGATSFATATDVHTAAGATTPIDINVATTGTIAGTVHDAAGGLAGILVWLTDAQRTLLATQNTDAGGNFSFASLRAGTYHLAFTDPTGAFAAGSEWLDAPDAADATPIDLVAGTTVRADQQLYLPADQPIPAYSGNAAGPRVAVIGDSITQQSTHTINATMAPEAWSAVRGINNQRIGQLQPVADRFASTDPTQVVIALGTNDAIQGWPLASSEADLETMIASFPAARCVDVLTVTDQTLVPSVNETAQALDAFIRGLPASHPQVQVVDWQQVRARYVAAGEPQGAWTIDTVHLNELGQSVYAGLMRDAVRSCGAPPSSLSGVAFDDANGNGVRDAAEPPMAGVAISVAGVDALGAAVQVATTTQADGTWSVPSLRAGTYTVTQTAPAGYRDGTTTTGTSGGTHTADAYAGVVLAAGTDATAYDFAEVSAAAPPTIVTLSYEPGVGPWQQQTLGVWGVTGTYTLEYHGVTTAPLAPGAPACWAPGATTGPCSAGSVQAALEAVGAHVTVTDGPDGITTSPVTRYSLAFDAFDETPVGVDDTAMGSGGSATVDCVHCVDTEAAPVANANGASVIYVHGGGFFSGDRNDGGWSEARARFEAAGYRTFSIDYRLLDPDASYFVPQALGATCDWGVPDVNTDCARVLAAAERASEDVNHAVAWVRGQAATFAVDPHRVAVLGFSAGAIASLNNHYGAAATDGRPDVTVSLSGIMDTARQTGPAGPVLLFEYGGADPVYAGGFLPGIDGEQRDEDILARARAVGNVAALRTYPGVGHSIGADSPFFDDMVSTTLTFLGEQLGPTPPASPLAGTWFGGPTSIGVGIGHMPGHATGAPPRPLVGDFDGDGRDDVIWHDPTRATADMIWFGTADGMQRDPREWTSTYLDEVPALPADGPGSPTVLDVDGDGVDDVLWYDATTGTAALWHGQPSGAFAVVALPAMAPGLELHVGHHPGDGAEDVVAFSPVSLDVEVLAVDPTGSVTVRSDTPGVTAGAVPVVGDFNGDGHTDLYWQGATVTPLWLATGDGAGFTPTAGPSIGTDHLAVLGDYDADGATDVVWYDPATGADTELWYGHADGQIVVLPLGSARPGLQWAALDHRGDGHADLLVYVPGLGALVFDGGPRGSFSVAYVTTAVPASVTPTVLDIDGDGRDDVSWHG